MMALLLMRARCCVQLTKRAHSSLIRLAALFATASARHLELKLIIIGTGTLGCTVAQPRQLPLLQQLLKLTTHVLAAFLGTAELKTGQPLRRTAGSANKPASTRQKIARCSVLTILSVFSLPIRQV
jgi:hypothetical protein